MWEKNAIKKVKGALKCNSALNLNQRDTALLYVLERNGTAKLNLAGFYSSIV